MYASPVHSRALVSRSDASPDKRPVRDLRAIREPESTYRPDGKYPLPEVEGSERRTLGSLIVSSDANWAVTLTVPVPDGRAAFLELERRGPLPAGYRGGEETALVSVPVPELEPLLALLTGIVARARRDGVLPGADS